jgi:hypothetical protein
MPTRREFLAATAMAALGPQVLDQAVASATQPAGDQPTARANTLLLVDDFHVLYRPGTKRALHPLKRYAKNPVIPGGEKGWDQNIAWCSVHRDARGKYQIWYQAYAGSRAKDRTRRCTVCYAESDDGIAWRRPALGLFDYGGENDTNMVVVANGVKSDRYGASVVIDSRDPDASRRYKMAYFDFAKRDGVEYPGMCVAFSPDGIHWKKHERAPLLIASYGNKGDDVPFADDRSQPWTNPLAMSDAMDVFWDPVREVFAAYGKMWIDDEQGKMYGKHACGRSESRDFVNWSKPEMVMAPDEKDPAWVEFHTTPVFYHAGVYFGCPEILNRELNGGVMDVELAVSRDGVKWDRPFRQPFFLPKGEGKAFDSGSVFTNASPVILDDEIRFYYGGYSGGATGGHEFVDTTGIGLATTKRDRFAGVRPIERVGQVTLRAVDLSGVEKLLVNADAAGGSIRVEILDDNARQVRGFSKDDAVELRGDSLRHEVKWKAKGVSDLKAGKYMLRLHLENAEVFAVQL